MTQPPPSTRRHTRTQLVLKVEFDDRAGFRSNFLSDLSQGGVRINASLVVGQRLTLNISFLGFVEPLQIDAVVQWSLPATDPDGPASGLAFVDVTPEAQSWLGEVLDASSQIAITPEEPSRVLLLEAQPFLREVYGQEVRNWAELRDEEPLDLIAIDDPKVWLEEAKRAPATLGIVDVDDLATSALELYRAVREHEIAKELPLIVLGSVPNIDPFLAITDERMFCLRKPLRFGVLMNTVRALARVG